MYGNLSTSPVYRTPCHRLYASILQSPEVRPRQWCHVAVGSPGGPPVRGPGGHTHPAQPTSCAVRLAQLVGDPHQGCPMAGQKKRQIQHTCNLAHPQPAMLLAGGSPAPHHSPASRRAAECITSCKHGPAAASSVPHMSRTKARSCMHVWPNALFTMTDGGTSQTTQRNARQRKIGTASCQHSFSAPWCASPNSLQDQLGCQEAPAPGSTGQHNTAQQGGEKGRTAALGGGRPFAFHKQSTRHPPASLPQDDYQRNMSSAMVGLQQAAASHGAAPANPLHQLWAHMTRTHP